MGQLPRLTEQEGELFEALQTDVLGERVRMEQERIGFSMVLAAVHG